ncbi:MAG TPA: dihydroorotate dehydrogenase [Candidatus Acetothermia bacterium]|nr:dihydroorotate dehydrogenase [Candidatus Acetothermia bacterium]
MRVVVGGLRLRNPVIAASGTFGFGAEYAEIYDPARLGAVCTKGLTLMPRQGNPPPRLWETAGGLLNSIGLQNPGIEAFIREELPRMKAQGITVITNVWGNDPGEYERSVARLCDSSVDAIEINVSCPNVSRGGPVGEDAIRTAAVVRRSRKVCTLPLWVKLPPAGGLAVARTAQEEGADAVSAVNTFRGMAIDIKTGKPVFVNVVAGLSGPAIKPIALRIVYELAAALTIPVVGIGGIGDWRDALEFIMAGAHAVQVGTANFVDPLAAVKIVAGLEKYMEENKITDWEGIRGNAQQ